MISPTRSLELRLLREHPVVVGIDEVGRGSLAGPVCVGAALVTRSTARRIPEGLRDSKLVPVASRAAVAERARGWVEAHAVGAASAAEVDERGIVAALRLAASRALGILSDLTGQVSPAVILDGSHNYLEPTLLDGELRHLDFAEVVVRPKADAHCAVVAAASVIAKVYRDQLMCELEDPGYGFASHKGYGAAAHLDALREMGPCEHHRRSWRLPGVEAPVPGEAIAPEVAVEPPSPMVPATAGSRPVA